MSTPACISLDQIKPGRYVRRWAGYEVVVEVRWLAGELVAFPPSGWPCPLRTTPDADYLPVTNLPAA